MAWLPVNIAMILGHQDLTLGEGIDPLQSPEPWHCGPALAKTWRSELFNALSPFISVH
jgi:hypothetical protein